MEIGNNSVRVRIAEFASLLIFSELTMKNLILKSMLCSSLLGIFVCASSVAGPTNVTQRPVLRPSSLQSSANLNSLTMMSRLTSVSKGAQISPTEEPEPSPWKSGPSEPPPQPWKTEMKKSIDPQVVRPMEPEPNPWHTNPTEPVPTPSRS